MKLISSGFINKILDVQEEKLRKEKRDLTEIGKAFETRYSPYNRPIVLKSKNVLNDPSLFQNVWQKKDH